MNIPKVKNMNSQKSGQPVANQYIINTDEGVYFQSYRTLIAFKDNRGQIFLDQDNWDYSRTTIKYLSMFLGCYASETRKKIKSGEYKLVNLN